MSSAKSKLSKSRSEKARTAQGAVPHKKSEPGEKPRRQDATAHATALNSLRLTSPRQCRPTSQNATRRSVSFRMC